MKKSLLLSLAIACGISANAQLAKNVQPAVSKAVVPTMVRTATSAGKLNAEFNASATKVTNFSKARRAATVSDLEAIYDIPEGAWISGVDPTQGWYGVPFVYTPGLVDQVWKNYSSSSDEVKPIIYDWSDSDEQWDGWDQNEDGHGVANMFGVIKTPLLTASQGQAEATYQLGQEGSAGFGYWFGGTSEFERLGKARFGTGNGPYGGFTGLELNTNTPGEQTAANGTTSPYFESNIVGFAQLFDAPNDFAVATSATITLGCDDNSLAHPLNGQKITCTIYEIEEDGSLGEPVKVIEAGEENCIPLGDWLVSIEFPFVEEDPLFGEIESPLYVNGKDLLVTFSGFDKVQNTYFAPFCSAAGFVGGGYMLLADGSMSSVYYRGSSTPQIDFMVSLTAAMPVLEPAGEYSTPLVIPAEGGYAVTASEDGQDFNDFDVLTLNSDPDEFLVYTNDEEDEWVVCEVDDSYADRGYMLFYFGAEALPEGVEGRSCIVTIDLYGKTIEIPVVQGVVEDGIESVKVKNNSKLVYNLAGQRVNAAQKGIFIKNGKKFVK